MANQYGPWATMIDVGGNPQLSAFWRRRLTMLAPASQTSLVLSRGNLFWLGAAAVLMLALPTFRVATAVANDEQPTGQSGNASGIVLSSGSATSAGSGDKSADKASPGKGPAAEQHASGSLGMIGIFTTSADIDSNYLLLPVYV